jgi:hypothetical protein
MLFEPCHIFKNPEIADAEFLQQVLNADSQYAATIDQTF